MKLIIAYVRPERLTAVKQALYARQIYSMSVTNILGAGRQKGYTETYRGVVSEVNLLKKVRIEIGIKDELEADALEAVTEGARTGKEGDGVVFVMDVAKGQRIRTGDPVA
ncbi:P-II family nitrogen regulator [Desulfovibrio oxamicus]|uniref:P-II family nitrogen regulator n=1 Tax=Nitratidesulfovibrio oxamicus TaxID=32016 RepID=A0ABS0J0U8_9BACT|nr:P-II family nitrogen regulator [Nitratidesulfovibrio oxamicus]MBG3875787.1 P-II family nitrogen regulator [Nitratidesulfovibrio oxamicus]